jgi:hypothetical protein
MGTQKLTESTGEGQASGQQEEGHHAERVLIASGRGLAVKLLRRHVRSSPCYLITLGERV